MMFNTRSEGEDPLILVVDDTPENRMLLNIMLKNEGYRVELAEDGNKALAKLEACEPDLVLLDVMMPGRDGFEVCQAMQQTPSWAHIPVIFMTALGETEDKVKAFSVGGVDYVVKPFVVQEILARVRVHIQLKQAMTRMQALAVTDALTGAYNRRFAFEVLEKALQRGVRHPDQTLVGYLDIDGLKQVNDRLGHQSGDQLILAVVDALRATLRTSDYLCRMGGDEFLLIMPDCGVDDFHALMERVKVELAKNAKQADPPEFSYGYASHQPWDGPVTAEELISQADQEMYSMKMTKRSAAK